MTMSPIRFRQLQLGITGLIILGGASAFALWQLPTLRTHRSNIDTARANIQAIELQQQNLEILKNQQDQVSAASKRLGRDIWQFTQEDDFYAALDHLADSADVTVEEPKVSDAVPNGSYQARQVTVSMTGTTVQLLNAIRDMMILQPLLSIKQVTLAGGSTARATVTAQTVWQ